MDIEFDSFDVDETNVNRTLQESGNASCLMDALRTVRNDAEPEMAMYSTKETNYHTHVNKVLLNAAVDHIVGIMTLGYKGNKHKHKTLTHEVTLTKEENV